MPEIRTKGSLTDEQIDRAVEWLSGKIKDRQQICEVCGHNQWIVDDKLVTPANLVKGGGVSIGGKISPQFMVICQNCANTKYFNAILAGVFDPQEEKEEDK